MSKLDDVTDEEMETELAKRKAEKAKQVENNKKKALADIEALLKQSNSILALATKIADEHGICFYHSIAGAYGSGCTYYPTGGEGDPEGETGWQSSSHSC